MSMNPVEKVIPQIKSLRMSGILDSLQVRNQQAVDQKLSYLEFLALVLTDEYERRENKKLQGRLRRASFEGDRTLDNYNYDAPDLEINRSQIYDLDYRETRSDATVSTDVPGAMARYTYRR